MGTEGPVEKHKGETVTTVCEQCGSRYDDEFRLTYCPHAQFNMQTVVGGPGGIVGVATTIEELNRMLLITRRGAR